MSVEKMYEHKLYDNSGNLDVALLVPPEAIDVLDIGCGAGATGILIKQLNNEIRIHGITINAKEAEKAAAVYEKVFIADLEREDLGKILPTRYDAIICSHILEHLKAPDEFIASISELLNPAGVLIVALPNIAHWKSRIKILFGKFDYEETGVMDDTHIRFFTYHSADQFIFRKTEKIQVTKKGVTGNAPLWKMRNILPSQVTIKLNKIACASFPNLLGSQILITAQLVRRK